MRLSPLLPAPSARPRSPEKYSSDPSQQPHPFPKVEAACDFVALLVEFEANFEPAFERAAFEGLPPLLITFTSFAWFHTQESGWRQPLY